MSQRSKLAFTVILAALLFGLLADRLLKETPWGLNVLLTIALLLAAVFGVSHWRRERLTGGGRWFALPALVFAGMLAVRDTATLNAFNVAAVLCCLAVLAYRGRTGRVLVAGIGAYLRSAVMGGIGALIGVLPLAVMETRWREFNLGGNSRLLTRLIFGVVLALPLLAIFGGLFAAADANFEQLLRDVFSFDLDSLIRHAFLSGLWAWLAAGMLWLLFFFSHNTNPAQAVRPARFSLSIIEIGVVLGLLNALFATFVITQLRYFFGGAALVLDTADASNQLTFAEYARRGFFELVVVSVLLLMVLLVAHWITRRDNPQHATAFRVLAGGLITLLYVIMASALHRMWTYMQVYGLTELRLYTTAFMLWLAVVFAWFAATTLRERGERFAFGAVISGLATLLVLNLINPIDLIVRTNIERIVNRAPGLAADTPAVTRSAERLDSLYLGQLAIDTSDAVPALMSNFSRLNSDDGCRVAAGLSHRYDSEAKADWRTTNISRLTAAVWQSQQWRQYFMEAGAACFDEVGPRRFD